MMRILYVSDAQSVHTKRWAESFRDQGAEVVVASFKPEIIDGVRVHVLPTFGLGRVGYFFAIPILRRLASRYCPDIVHAQYLTSYGFLAALAGLHPLILTAWGTDVLISPYKSRILRWFGSYAVRNADVITTVAQHMNAAVAELGVPIERISTIPFGVDSQRFLPPVARQAYPLRLICTRSLSPIYSIHTLLIAVQKVVAQGLNLQVDLVGDGPLKKELEAQVNRSGLSSLISFHGHVDPARMASLLADAHMFVSPAISDGNNVSLNEAMSCACFPIATDIPANAQWITDGVNGFLYPSGDSDCLAERIIQAARDVNLRERAGIINREIVETRADWTKSVVRMREIYNKVMWCAKQ